MKLELLEIGEQTKQLSACSLSLLLGVSTKNNRIAAFLKFARRMLQMDQAILVFREEPYGWYEVNDECHAFIAQPHDDFEFFFLGDPYIDSKHPNYCVVSNYIIARGVEHQRFIAISLKNDEGQSIGHVVLFDKRTDEFDDKQISIILEFAQSLIQILKLHLENAELKEMYEQQSALNFSKTKFFQVIAHDLRAPFHGLMGFSDVLAHERESLDEQSVQDIADYLLDTAHSTYNLLESLLTWAMAEGGRFFYHPISFDLHQSTTIVSQVLSGLAVKNNIELVVHVSSNIKVYADINMVTSVIQNLVSNALKFTPLNGTGKVFIKAEQDEDYTFVSVQDTGLGMNAKQLENLFEPSLTVSIKGISGEKGAGLGLVLCKRFVDLNFGEIMVTSKEGVGSIFKVKLPRHKQAIPEVTQ